MHVLLRLSAVVLPLLLGGCSMLEELSMDIARAAPGDRFPDVLAVELRPAGPRTYDVTVTLSSPYDTPERYADGWRVTDVGGTELGTHTLMHDHAAEQPFTRTQRGLWIPVGVEAVTVEGRDLVHGYGGATVTVEVPA